MRIWVTGVGMMTALGRTAETSWEAVVRGERGFSPVTLFDTAGCKTSLAAQIAEADLEGVAPASAGWSRTDAMAVAAAREALAGAGLAGEHVVDLVVGGTTAGMYETESLLAELHASTAADQDLDDRMLSHPLSATMDRLVEAVHPFRRARALCSACSSGANALILAASWLRTGRSERVLAGGSDGLCRVTFTGFNSLGAMSPEPCRPFDVARDGLTLGEGAAFLLVETEACARARGAKPLAELRGWATGSEAHHITNPEPSGETAAKVMREALRRGGLSPAEIDYVNAHGTATRLNDSMEAAAIRACLGEQSERIVVSSTKGQLGHTLGAAGAVEAIITAMSVARGVVPPTVGLEEVDPECRLQHLREPREMPVRAALSNSFGFGGSDAVLLFADPALASASSEAQSSSAVRIYVTGAGAVGPLGIGGSEAARGYLDEGEGPPSGPVAFDAKDHLDVGRARRLDRAARLAAAAMAVAMDEAGWDASDRGQVGAALGGAFGAVDACSAFLHRIYEKGARFASPAVFPNLLPSSAVAQASIYHGLRGPVLATADLEASAESAVVTAVELLAGGEVSRMIAGGVEPSSTIAEAVLGPVCAVSGRAEPHGPRSEGAAVIAFETGESLGARGGRALAEVVACASWRGDGGQRRVAALDPPSGRAAVFAGRADTGAFDLVDGTAWQKATRHVLAGRAGWHECVGGFAVAAAVGALAAGVIDEALIVGVAAGGGAALSLRRVSHAGESLP